MKRNLFILAFILCIITTYATDAPYYLQSAFGYGASATGGGNANPTLVGSVSELKSALKGSNKVIIITKSLTFTSMLTGQDLKNITLLALPGVTLTSNETNANKSGILYIKNSKNIIIRNITFIGPGAYDVDGNDLLCFQGVTDAWVDHCDFQDGLDGNFDNKNTTDNVTISWCRFRYLKSPIPGGSGGSDDHRYSNLLGSSATDKPSDGTYNFTWAYCWWDYGCKQRMVRCRNASLHFLNCYWNTSVADYYIGPENVDVYVEGCWMAKLSKNSRVFYENFSTSTAKNGFKFVNSYYAGGSLSDVNKRTVVVPTYKYTALTYDETKAAVSNTTCGAGATLQVTQKGEISAACDGSSQPDNPNPDDPKPDDPTPISHNLTWSADDNDIANLGTLTSSVNVRGLTIAAAADKNVTIDENKKTFTDGNTTISFAHRIKLGGTMADNARHLSFNVAGNATIEIYCISANSSESRPLRISENTSNSILGRSEISGVEVNRVVCKYQGPATTIIIGSEKSGINILGINVSGSEVTTHFTNEKAYISPAQKVIVNGNLYIQTSEGNLFTPSGQRVK